MSEVPFSRLYLLFQLATTRDLLPTILKLAGVEAKKNVTLDGYDMGPILFEGKEVRALNDVVMYTKKHTLPFICVQNVWTIKKYVGPILFKGKEVRDRPE